MKITKRSLYGDAEGKHEVLEFENGIKSDSLFEEREKFITETLLPLQKEMGEIEKQKERQAKIQSKIYKDAEKAMIEAGEL